MAEQQDWRMVKAVLDYRAMEQAKAIHNTDPTKMTEGQVRLWEEMVRACEEAEGNG